MRNEQIRTALRIHDVRQWQLAKKMGVSEMTIIRRLREELPQDEQDRICKLIEACAREVKKDER